MTASNQDWPDDGELNRRVTVRRRIGEPNPDMGITEQFADCCQRWAKIQPVSGAAYWGGEQVEEKITHRIWVKYGTGSKPEDVTLQHVIDHPGGNARYRVLRSVNVNDAQRYTMIECKHLGAIPSRQTVGGNAFAVASATGEPS